MPDVLNIIDRFVQEPQDVWAITNVLSRQTVPVGSIDKGLTRTGSSRNEVHSTLLGPPGPASIRFSAFRKLEDQLMLQYTSSRSSPISAWHTARQPFSSLVTVSTYPVPYTN